jgi:alginate O-acetyltransferase complex protein AlgI
MPLVLIGYFAVRSVGARNFFLMLASLFFYSWGEPEYCWVMLAVITVNFTAAIVIEGLKETRDRRLALALSVVTNLSVLGYFKYTGFLTENATAALKAFGAPAFTIGSVHLPLGISFFVFHCLSYVVDVYRGVAKAQRNPFNMALYISLFPQLIAGPIVRYHEISHQLESRTVTVEKFAAGIRRFVTGLGKKMLVANVLAVPADAVFSLPAHQLSMPIAWLGAICYTFQIYFDFSGYSDMAVGLGLMFGFTLPENFNYPYIARSIREFWQRWHMSLSNWFRDYLYVPLGGNRCPNWRVCLNLVTVFFLCGLWHGAKWQFVAWGLYHGFFLSSERVLTGKILEQLWTPVRHAYVAFVVVIGWVLFRADGFGQAMDMYKAMFGITAGNTAASLSTYVNSEIMLVLGVACLAAVPVRAALSNLANNVSALTHVRYSMRTAWCLALLALCVAEVAAGTYNPFIYFRF